MQNARFYATEQLSAHQSMTPEGYLLCAGVPIARTGFQLYAEGEIPGMTVDSDGILTIRRGESEVFHPDTIASFEGKPITIEHPDDFVDPDNIKELRKGHAQNVRRGEGPDSDLLIADLLITDADAIKLVRGEIPGKLPLREVSCGYDAGYVQDAPGAGHQVEIIGNHIALVPHGRAGRRCSIKDKEPIMAGKKIIPPSIAQRIRKLFATKDADGLAEMLSETTDEDGDEDDTPKKTSDSAAIKQLTKDVAALTAAVKQLTKDESAPAAINDVPTPANSNPTVATTADEAEEEAKEKVEVKDSLENFASRAEVLVPGFKLPTTDSLSKRTHVADAMRRVLVQADQTNVAPFLGGRTLDSMDLAAVSQVFNGAAALAGARNNVSAPRLKTTDFGKAPPTLAEVNKKNQDFWNQRNQA